MKFLPFKTLIAMLKFREDDGIRQHVASLDGEDIAFADYMAVTNKEAMDAWKTEVKRAIMRHSSTVVLRTACGCEQIKDLTRKEELRSLLIPLMWTQSAMAAFKEEADYEPFGRNYAREFRWKNRYHDNGAKVLEEEVTTTTAGSRSWSWSGSGVET